MKIPLLLTTATFLFSSWAPQKLQPRYNFFISFSCSVKVGAAPEQPLFFYLNPVEESAALRQTGIDAAALFTVTNASNETFLFLESENIKMVYPMDLEALKTTFGNTFSLGLTNQGDYSEVSPLKNNRVIKTGRTKEICGYLAYQYRMTHAEGSAELWVADFTHDTQQLYKLFTVMLFPLPTPNYNTMEHPLILELTIKNKQEETLNFKVEKIASVLFSFPTKGYQEIPIEK